MNKIENNLNEQLSDYCNKFKAVVIIQILLLSQRNFKIIYDCHLKLMDLYNCITSFIKRNYSQEIYDLFIEDKIDKIPNDIDCLKIVYTYRKKLSQLYFSPKIYFYKKTERIILSKLALELDPKNEAIYIGIANTLYKDKKYAETIKLYSLINEYTNTDSVLALMGDAYEKSHRYDLAIDCLCRRIKLDKENLMIKKDLNNLCEKVI